MQESELLNRYEGHPLGAALKNLNEAKDLNMLHDMYIASKSMILLLKHQGELTADDSELLEQYVDSRVDTFQPGGGQKDYS
tara:strand:+ start:9288 stop:9530 length:243 start_codon:yes stop_codon:yes gene_type:complete